MTDIKQVRTRYRQFAERECREYSELYFALANAAADDDELLRFIAQMPATQPNLFLASVQHVTGPDGMPKSARELRSALDAYRDDIARLMQSRRTQTNEVGRCAAILPALPTGPLALLEVGASAGLCLLLDQYYYDYGHKQLGDSSAAVRLRCRTNDSCPIPPALPEIGWRGGLDLAPVDVRNEDDANWLLSCVWADHVERRKRLTAAIRLAQSHKSLVHTGDLVGDLPSLLAEVPHDLQLVVFHSAALAYVSASVRQAFAMTLAKASQQRKIVWISNEGYSVVPEITALALAMPATQPAPFLLGRTTFLDGERSDEFLAFVHPHGAALEWMPTTGRADVERCIARNTQK